MKINLIKVIVFFKHLGFIKNIIIAVFAYLILTSIAIPEVQFNMQLKNPKSYTTLEIRNTPKNKLPRYFSVSDAGPFQNAFGLNYKIISMLGGYEYLTEHKIKDGDTTLTGIIYPVYSKDQFKGTNKVSASGIDCYIVIRDKHVMDADLKNDAYFKDSLYSVAGKFDGSGIDPESRKLLEESNYKINKDAILLEKGDSPMSMFNSILLTVAVSLVGLFCLLALIPLSVYEKMGRAEEEQNKVY